MWITSNKSDPAYIFLFKYSPELAESVREDAERTGAAQWVDSQNLDELTDSHYKKAIQEHNEKRMAALNKLLIESLAWWDLDE